MDRSPDLQIVDRHGGKRYEAPEPFLKSIHSRFPLCTIDGGGEPVPIAAEEVLGSRQDVILYLAR
jgi:hypothetical protein